jgi:hypothetical protein
VQHPHQHKGLFLVIEPLVILKEQVKAETAPPAIIMNDGLGGGEINADPACQQTGTKNPASRIGIELINLKTAVEMDYIWCNML